MSPTLRPPEEVRLKRTAMSTRELRRAEVLGRVKAETLRLVDAAKMLELSYRQAKRLWQRYREEGAKGLQQSDIPEVLVSRTKRESSHLAVPGPQSAGAVPAASGALSVCAPGSTIPPPTVCEWEDERSKCTIAENAWTTKIWSSDPERCRSRRARRSSR